MIDDVYLISDLTRDITKILRSIIIVFSIIIFPISNALSNDREIGKSNHVHLPESQPLNELVFSFVEANILATLYHEFGHALISLYRLPVLGRQEDAADSFAALMLLNTTRDSHTVIHGAYAWALSSRKVFVCDNDGSAIASIAPWKAAYRKGDSECVHQLGDDWFWDVHALDRQRYFSLLCFSVGLKPHLFMKYARLAGMPYGRIEQCANDYWDAAKSWWGLLESEFVNKNVAKESGRIDIYYDEQIPKGWDAQYWDDVVSFAIPLIDQVADDILNFVVLPNDLIVTLKACDMDNAYWDHGEMEIVLCYEHIDSFISLILHHIDSHPEETVGGYRSR